MACIKLSENVSTVQIRAVYMSGRERGFMVTLSWDFIVPNAAQEMLVYAALTDTHRTHRRD
jgi:hypothetical protein